MKRKCKNILKRECVLRNKFSQTLPEVYKYIIIHFLPVSSHMQSELPSGKIYLTLGKWNIVQAPSLKILSY